MPRSFLPAAAMACLLAGCGDSEVGRAAPLDRFYYPAGIAQADVVGGPDGGQGVLYVANANYDKRYTHGTVLAVDLDAVGLPAFGAEVGDGGPPILPDLHIGGDSSVLVADFANEMRTFPIDGGVRLFIPSRSEDNRLNIIDAVGTSLTCFDNPSSRDCGAKSPNLIALASTSNGLPQAPQPSGVGISANGKVVVTHQGPAKLADSTAVGSFYVVEMDAQAPALSTSGFISISPCTIGTCVGGSQSAAVGTRYAYVTGKIGEITSLLNQQQQNNTGFGTTLTGTNLPIDTSVALPGNVLRYVELAPDINGVRRVGSAQIEQAAQLFEGRGVAVNADESRLYLVARGLDSFTSSGPSFFIAIRPIGPQSDAPTFQILTLLPLPERSNALHILPRAGRGDLVLVVASDASALVVYDDEQGRIVANVNGLGDQPDELAVDFQGAGVRIYVSNFTDGQVTVLDMPDLAQPQEMRVVARLGTSQACVTRPNDPACMAVTP